MDGLEYSPRRPASWTALCFGAGLLPAHYAHLPVLHLVIGSAVLFFLVLCLYRRERLRGICLGLLLLALGALRYEADTELLPPSHIANADLFNRAAVIRGRIVEEPERTEERIRFALGLEEVETDSAVYAVSGRVLVTVKEVGLAADCGDRLSLRGKLRRPQPARNPGAFDYREFLALRGIHGTSYVKRREQIVAVEDLPGSRLYEWLVRPVRGAIRETIQRNLSGPPAGLLQGMLLGEKYRIPDEVKDIFRKTGLAHALVINSIGWYSSM